MSRNLHISDTDLNLVSIALEERAQKFDAMADALADAAFEQDDMRAHAHWMAYRSSARRLRIYAERVK